MSEKRAFGWRLFFYEREPPRREQKEEENKLDQWLLEIFIFFILLYTFDFNENGYGVKNTEGLCATEEKQ